MLYKIAFSFLPVAKPVVIANAVSAGLKPKDFFLSDAGLVLDKCRLRCSVAEFIAARDKAIAVAEREVKFIEANGIKLHSLWDAEYPWLLRQIPDAPLCLYQLGEMELGGEHNISIVGTRRCTGYGAGACKMLVDDLAAYFSDLKVISGLAYGIDAAAHTAALDAGVETAAVVAHGLDMIYPSGNRDLAKRIIRSGGAIITEYPSCTTPYAARFLERNRIVAGLSQFTMVVESEVKGGAMSTANLAFNYNREVGALPGRYTDKASGGCNLLIRSNKAALITSAAEVITASGWKPLDFKLESRQLNLFPELKGIAAQIYELLKFSAEPMALDAIQLSTGIAVSELMASLTELEFDGIIVRLPGGRYSLS